MIAAVLPTPPSCERLPRSVFITGASGFIGRALLTRFVELGTTVRGVDLRGDVERDIVEGDVSVAGPWTEHVADVDVVIHTAAIVNNVAPAQRFWSVNVAGTANVAHAAAAAGATRLVHLSSVRVFSDVDFPDGVTEDHPVRPDGHRYVDTKIASEQVVLQAHAGGLVPVVVLRPGDVYGPGSVPWTIWPVVGIANGSFFVPDDGAGIFSPVYVDNLVDAVVLAASEPAALGQVLTISDGLGVRNDEFFGCYAEMLGTGLPLLPAAEIRTRFEAIAAEERAGGRSPTLSADTVDYLLRTGTYSIAKARRVLGYAPSVDLAEGMRRTEAWLRSVGLLR